MPVNNAPNSQKRSREVVSVSENNDRVRKLAAIFQAVPVLQNANGEHAREMFNGAAGVCRGDAESLPDRTVDDGLLEDLYTAFRYDENALGPCNLYICAPRRTLTSIPRISTRRFGDLTCASCKTKTTSCWGTSKGHKAKEGAVICQRCADSEVRDAIRRRTRDSYPSNTSSNTSLPLSSPLVAAAGSGLRVPRVQNEHGVSLEDLKGAQGERGRRHLPGLRGFGA